jgi:hypothetical protein
MQTNWATVGGILSIVSGVLGILQGVVFVFFGVFFNWLMRYGNTSIGYDPALDSIAVLMTIIYGAIGLGYCLLGVLALIGGIFGIRKKLWGLALAGAIASILTFLPTGVVAIIFTSMARPEFLSSSPTTTAKQA